MLTLYPASRLDWLVLTRLTAGTLANMPGNPLLPHGHVLHVLDHYAIHAVAPLLILGAAVGPVVLCWSGRWNPPDLDPPYPVDSGRDNWGAQAHAHAHAHADGQGTGPPPAPRCPAGQDPEVPAA